MVTLTPQNSMVNVYGGILSHTFDYEMELTEHNEPVITISADDVDTFAYNTQSMPNSATNSTVFANIYKNESVTAALMANIYLPSISTIKYSDDVDNFETTNDDLGNILFLTPTDNTQVYNVCSAYVIPDLFVCTKNQQITHNPDFNDPTMMESLKTFPFTLTTTTAEEIYTYEIIV